MRNLLLLLLICGFEMCFCFSQFKIDNYTLPFDESSCNLSPKIIKEIKGYQPIVNKIIDEIVNGKFQDDIFDSINDMVRKFGPRFVGTKALENAIDYMVEELKSEGLENVHTEQANVQNWTRGYEIAKLLSPHKKEIKIGGLGTSVGTSPEGITGDVVVVESFDELHKMPDEKVKGRIVVFVPKWRGYGRIIKYNSRGAVEASKKGAIASLIRSATPFYFDYPSSGMQSYEKGVKAIPTACITVDDAEILLQMYKNGERIQMHLKMDDRNLKPIISRNTIAELTGTVHKNESVVVLSGHLDSWNYTNDPVDDIGGAFISWKAIKFLKEMGFRPKRTIRAILWTGEKFGLMGAQSYQAAHSLNERGEFNFFLEADNGRHKPAGLEFSGNKDAACILKEILNLMEPLNATQIQIPMNGGADIDLWASRGFPGATLLNSNNRYYEKILTFTLLKLFNETNGILEHPVNLEKCTAFFAAVAYVIADLSMDFPKDIPV